MKTFAINTLGCKVNQYESQQIRSFLCANNLQFVADPAKADLLIIHTCSVTHTASAKSRQLVRKAQRANPNAQIIVSGCLVNSCPDELKNLEGNILFISSLAQLFETLNNNIIPVKKDNNYLKDKNLPPELIISRFFGRTRAFLKVQDGCDGYCSYCIIPRTRPQISSKPLKIALKEAQQLVKSGHKEIILTGIFLGAYSQNSVKRKNWPNRVNPNLPELIEKIAQLPGLKRLRLSSLEPADVTDSLLDVFCKYDNIMPHLHLSLQSGSEKILKKMNRQYCASEFLSSIEKINARLDRPAITTDIIVGFPGENDEDFAETLNIAKKVGFSKIHIFPFSKRAGTAAEKMQPFVKPEIVKQRIKKLRQLEHSLATDFKKQFIGQKAEVLIENEQRKTGKCERYYEIKIETEAKLKNNQIINCIIQPDAATAKIY